MSAPSPIQQQHTLLQREAYMSLQPALGGKAFMSGGGTQRCSFWGCCKLHSHWHPHKEDISMDRIICVHQALSCSHGTQPGAVMFCLLHWLMLPGHCAPE